KEHVKLHRKNPRLIVDGPAINITGEKNLLNPPFESFFVRMLAFLDFGGATFITANTSCLVENLIKAGGFDEEFGKGYGWQDREFGRRLLRAGLKRVKNRRAYALHYKGNGKEEDMHFLFQKYRERGENAILYYSKHPSKKTKREIHLNYLKYSNFFTKIGLDRKTSSPFIHKKPLFFLFKKVFFIHAYAEGLKKGVQKYKVEI
ncbi:hypothetical protein H5U35_01710, partial [Candidatus Aerophobetes bacterium]|nr:hypothetical protein [Candidatus Aerophobetes bacterium]